MDLDPGTMVGEYRVVGKLGEGGMASVYSAVHPLIDKRVAIKVMSPALSQQSHAVTRFVQEARAVNQINHPNIIDAFSFGWLSDGRSYFVMEWIDGVTLAERLRARPLGVDEALRILDQIADALEGAHDAGVIHRDLKPANVLLVPERGRGEQVKLLDFGVAKLASGGESQPGCTRDGCVVGTPEYISPEQARAKDVDGRTDVYSLGVMSYEMLAGELPFCADNPLDLMRMHLDTPVPRVRARRPDTPAELDAAIARMMDKESRNRPTLAELRALISKLRQAPPVRPRPAHSRALVAAAMAVMAIAVGVLIGTNGAAHPAKHGVEALALGDGTRAEVAQTRVRAAEPSHASAHAVEPARASSHAIEPARASSPAGVSPRAVETRREHRPRKVARARDPNYLVDPFGGAR